MALPSEKERCSWARGSRPDNRHTKVRAHERGSHDLQGKARTTRRIDGRASSVIAIFLGMSAEVRALREHARKSVPGGGDESVPDDCRL